MSAGNPLEARHPLRGLETGDAIAYTVVTGAALAEMGSRGIAAAMADMAQGAKGTSDVLVLAFPTERRQAILESLEKATIDGRAT